MKTNVPARPSFFDRFRRTPLTREQLAANSRRLRFPVAEPLETRIAPAVTITATLTGSPSTVNPGGNIHYTEIIMNSGSTDATTVQIAHVLANSSLVPGSLNISPLAGDDSYTAIGNTELIVGGSAGSTPAKVIAGNLFANDSEFANDLGTPDTFTLSSYEALSANSGTVVMNSDGTFKYTPAVGFTGTDTFHYTITDDGIDGIAGNADDLTGTATVTITVANKVWYVDNTAGTNGTGTSKSPFNTLAAFQAINDNGGAATHAKTGDFIYLSQSGTNYTGGVTLLGSQTLLGSGVALVVAGTTLKTAGTNPTLVNTGGHGVTLSTNNTLSGFNIGGSATGSYDISGTAVGNLAIDHVSLTGTTGGLINIGTSGALNVTLDSVASSTTTGSAISLTGATGTFKVTAGAIGGAAGTEVLIAGGTATIDIGASVASTAGGSIDISGRAAGAGKISFTGALNITGGTGLFVHANTGGIVEFSNASKVINTGANTAVNLLTNPGATINFIGGGLDIDTTTGVGFTAVGGGTVTVTGSGNSITSASGSTALNFNNTSIAATGLIFQNITSNGGSSPGIVLDTTGTAGGLTVTGTGTNGSGGSISNKTGTGSDANGTDGITLNSTVNTSLSWMTISDNNRNGILGTSVNGIKFDHLVIDSNGDQLSPNESNIRLVNLSGTLLAGSNPTSITNSTVTNAYEQNIEIENSTGTLTDMQFNSDTVSNNGASGQAVSQILVTVSGGSTYVTVQDSTITGNRTAGALTAGGVVGTVSAGTLSMKVLRNSLLNHNVGVDLSTSTSGVLNFDVSNNGGSGNTANNGTANGKISGSDAIGISIFTNNNSTGSVNGFIRGNTVGTQGVAGSGSAVGRGIQIQNEGGINTTVLISGNIVQSVSGNQEINVQHGITGISANGTTNVTITGNTLRDNAVGSSRPLNAEILNGGTMNLSISGNTFSNNQGQGGGNSLLRVNRGTTNSPVLNITQATPTSGANVNELDDANGLSFGGGQVTVSVSPAPNFGTAAPALPTAFLMFAPSEPAPATGSGQTPVTNTTPTEIGGGTTTPPVQPPVVVGNDDGYLDQSELDALVKAAIARWEATGLTPAQDAILHSVTFGVTDLGGRILGEATTGHVTLDKDGAGNGWFVDSTPLDDSEFTPGAVAPAAANRVDALTTVMHELGHQLGLDDTYSSADSKNLMYGFLTLGTRHSPLAHQADGATGMTGTSPDYALSPITIGTLPAGKTIKVVFDATAQASPVPAGVNNISLQGTISGGNFSNVLTDDTSVGGATDPTVVALNAQPDLKINSYSDGLSATTPGSVVTYTINYANVGNQDATGAFLTATVPSGATIDAASTTAGWTQVSGSTYKLNIGNLGVAAGAQSTTFKVDFTNPAPAGVETFSSTVTIDDDHANGTDPVAANNTLSDNGDALTASPNLKIVKSDGGANASPGGTVSYTLTYSNIGNQTANTARLLETVPVGTTFSAGASTAGWTLLTPGAGGAGSAGSTYELAVGSLIGGAGASTATFAVNVGSPFTGGTQVSNTATIDYALAEEANSADNTSTDTTPVTGSIGDRLWYDLNNNGVQDAGEPGIVGATVNLVDSGSAVVGTATTGANGAYLLNNVVAGTYTVQVVTASLPAGLTTATFDLDGTGTLNTASVILTAGQNRTDVDFGYRGTGTAGDSVWYDINNNGVQDAGEPGLGGVTVTLTGAGQNGIIGDGDDFTLTTTTSSTGAYSFGNLAQGNYKVAVATATLQAGTTPSFDLDGTASPHQANFTLNAGSPSSSLVDFGYTGTGSIGDRVWRDTNQNGIQEGGETGLNGLTITLVGAGPNGTFGDSDDITFASKTTAGDGNYTFSNLIAGNYRVAVNPAPAGLIQTYDLNGPLDHSATVALTAGQNVTGADFGYRGGVDLVLTKTDGNTATTPGSTLVYALTHQNVGTTNATGVVLTETLPVGTTFNAGASTAGWTETFAGSGIYKFTVGNEIGGAAAGTVNFAVTVNSVAASGLNSISNTASIADDGNNGADLTPANNTTNDSDTLNAAPDLKLTKTDGFTSTTPGSALTYAISYSNAGNQNATGVVLTETLPTGTTFNAGASSAGWVETAPGSKIYILAVGALAGGGGSGTANFAVNVTNPAAAGLASIINTSSIADDATNGTDLTPADNSFTDTDTLTAAPDLKIVSSNGATSVTPGGASAYVLTYTNTGNQGATGVVLHETLPAGTTFNAGASTAGWTETAPGSGLYTLTLGSTVAGGGGTGTATFAVTVNNPAAAGLNAIGNAVSINDDLANGTDPNTADNSATESDTLNAAPDLVLTKTDGTGTTTPGSTLTYALSYTNNGNQGATGVKLTETVPTGTTFDAANSTAGWTETTPGSGVYTFTVGALAGGGGSGTANFAVKVATSAPAGQANLVNTASIADDAANGTDPNPGDNSTTDTDVLNANSDLTLTKTDGTTSTTPGSALTYTLNYGNSGNQTATGVVLTEHVPTGTSFNAAGSTAGWVETTPGSGTYTLAIGTLIGGATGSATFAVQVNAVAASGAGTVANSSSIADDNSNGADPTPANNTATDTDTLNADPDLKITKTDGITSTTPGSTLTYAINYSNTGNQSASGAFLTETLPAGTTFNAGASTAGWFETAPGSGIYRLPIGGVAGGGGSGTANFAVNVTSPAPAGLDSIVNVTSIGSDTINGFDVTPADNTFTDTDVLNAAPDLKITSDNGVTSATPGSGVNYTLTYTNTGNQGATGVVLHETLPTGASFNAAASTAGWTETSPGSGQYTLTLPGAVAGGGGTGTATFAVTLNTPAAAGLSTLSNAVSINDDAANGADPNPADNSATENDAIVAAPDFTLTKTDGTVTTTPGSSLIYSINYANTGNKNATGVVVTETLPTGATFDAANSTAGWTETSVGSGIYKFNVGALAGGGGSGSVNFAVKVKDTVAAGLTDIANTASITDDGNNGTDPNLGNNSATDTDTLNAAPDLTITKTDGLTLTTPGSTLTYAVNYKNNGNQDATGVVLTETLPVGTTFTGTGWTETAPGSGIYTHTVGSLAAGDSGSVNFAVHVNGPAAAGLGSIDNTSKIADDAANGTDPNTADNTATDSDALAAAPDLKLTLSDSPLLTKKGGTVTYTANYVNAGNQDATGVVLTMNLPANTTYSAAASSVLWTETSPGSGVYTYAVPGTVAAGAAAASVTFGVKVNTVLPAGFAEVSLDGNLDDGSINGPDPTPGDNSDNEKTPIYQGIYVVAPGIAQSNKFGPPKVRVFDPVTGNELYSFLAYEPTYKDSIRVAVGDMNGDGIDDIITTTGKGTGRLRVFDGLTGAQFTTGAFGHEIAVFDGKKDKGAFVAAGDLNGDGKDDIVVGSALGGGKVEILDGVTGTLTTFASNSSTFFQPFGKTFKGGVRVATGDTNGDGKDELVVGMGYQGAQVKVYSGTAALNTIDGTVLQDFKIGVKSYKGGVSVATGDLNGDHKADLIIGRNTGKPTQVETFRGYDLQALGGPILPFDANPLKPKYTLGVRVAAVDVNFDGIADIIAGAGGKADSQVKIYDGVTHALIRTLTAYPDFLNQSLFVAGSSTIPGSVLPPP